MKDIVDPRAALDEVAHQRDELAARITVPGSYLVLDVLAVGTVLAIPRLSRPLLQWPHTSYAVAAVMVLSVMAYSQWPLVVRYTTGTRLPGNIRAAYPSVRRPLTITLIVFELGVVVGVLAEDAPLAVWIGSVVVFAVLVTICQQRVLAAIRHDVRTGQVASG